MRRWNEDVCSKLNGKDLEWRKKANKSNIIWAAEKLWIYRNEKREKVRKEGKRYIGAEDVC